MRGLPLLVGRNAHVDTKADDLYCCGATDGSDLYSGLNILLLSPNGTTNFVLHNLFPFNFHFSLYHLSLCIVAYAVVDDDELSVLD